LTIYGLEDCCSGNQQTRFEIGNGSFTSFSNTDGLTAAAVPEAQSDAMLPAGLGLIGTVARRRSNKQARRALWLPFSMARHRRAHGRVPSARHIRIGSGGCCHASHGNACSLLRAPGRHGTRRQSPSELRSL
jgi:hypothetical protein